MSDYVVTLQRDIELPPEITATWLRNVARRTLQHQRQPRGLELSLVLTNDETISQLNRQYRQVDGPTDVLAFPSHEGEPFVLPSSARRHLGDVIISLETAERQASEQHHATMRELALLIVHGCLHLLGYDHAIPEDEKAMWALQEEILRDIWGETHAS